MRGTRVSLTATEFELLAELARRAGQPLSREQLVRTVRGVGYLLHVARH